LQWLRKSSFALRKEMCFATEDTPLAATGKRRDQHTIRPVFFVFNFHKFSIEHGIVKISIQRFHLEFSKVCPEPTMLNRNSFELAMPQDLMLP